MEIQKIFSEVETGEVLYSVLMDEDEMALYNQYMFAIIGDGGVPNMVMDPKTKKMVRNPKLFKGGEKTVAQMRERIEKETADVVKKNANKAARRAERVAKGEVIAARKLGEKAGAAKATVGQAISNLARTRAGKAKLAAAGALAAGTIAGAGYVGSRIAKNGAKED